jgi:5-methyltetrahydrofolate--homocysteine methyltransferase
VIGMSGLLVKSTVIMKENLEEMNGRGVSSRFPVLLGGAALTRAFVEQDLAEMYDGEVRYAKDAFEGLALMDAVMAVKRGEPGAALPERRKRRVRRHHGPWRLRTPTPHPTSPATHLFRRPLLGRPDRQGRRAQGLRRIPR